VNTSDATNGIINTNNNTIVGNGNLSSNNNNVFMVSQQQQQQPTLYTTTQIPSPIQQQQQQLTNNAVNMSMNDTNSVTGTLFYNTNGGGSGGVSSSNTNNNIVGGHSLGQVPPLSTNAIDFAHIAFSGGEYSQMLMMNAAAAAVANQMDPMVAASTNAVSCSSAINVPFGQAGPMSNNNSGILDVLHSSRGSYPGTPTTPVTTGGSTMFYHSVAAPNAMVDPNMYAQYQMSAAAQQQQQQVYQATMMPTSHLYMMNPSDVAVNDFYGVTGDMDMNSGHGSILDLGSEEHDHPDPEGFEDEDMNNVGSSDLAMYSEYNDLFPLDIAGDGPSSQTEEGLLVRDFEQYFGDAIPTGGPLQTTTPNPSQSSMHTDLLGSTAHVDSYNYQSGDMF